MTKSPNYKTAGALRQALENRLQREAESGRADLTRMRRQVAFDRLLARVFAQADCPWVLKGGYSLELRLEQARTTRDIDLTLVSPAGLPEATDLSARLRAGLQNLADMDLRDFFEFKIGQVTLEIDAAPYGGARFPVDARLAGRSFVKFHVDIGVGDAVVGARETLNGRNWLGFAGIQPPRIVCVSKEQQFAEKLHAYTMPDRPTPNSRVKDLVDMALLVSRLSLEPAILQGALHDTFHRRNTHAAPVDLTKPPAEWEAPFAILAAEADLGLTMAEAFKSVRSFYLQTAAIDQQETRP